jgi:predicted Zn finger-like uncharacterized protein
VPLVCPRCGTRYRVPSASPGVPPSTYRCTRCRHLFVPAARRSRPAAELPDDEITFDFAGEPDLTPPARSRGPADPPAFAAPEPAAADEPPEPAFTADPSPQPTEADAMPDPRVFPSLRLGIRFQALVLVAFAALSLYLSTHPAEMLDLIGRVPLVGSGLLADRSLADALQIVDLRGALEQLKGGRPAFIVSGKVVNNSSHALGAIQVEARLYGDGGEIARKTIFAGSQASLRIVRTWSSSEVAIFEKIKPPKTYKLGPGEASDFLIVFQEGLRGMRSFACQVVAALPAVG